MKALHLRNHIELFKSENDYSAFISILVEAVESDENQVVIDGQETVCTMLGPEAARELLYNRLREAVKERPEILDEIKEGLLDTDLVDAPPPAPREDENNC